MSAQAILLIGRDGQLARAIQELAQGTDTRVDALDRASLDLAEGGSIRERLTGYLSAQRPSMVINAAAYTAVDQAETDRALAQQVNGDAPGYIAEACAAHDVPLAHISTDYVFSGDNTQPWTEDDPTAPLSVYGKSKLAGERAVASAWQKHLIIRTSWLFSGHGRNFLTTMLRLSKSRDRISVVNDQIGCPTPVPSLARALLGLASAQTRSSDNWGIYNYCGATSMSWADFARQIFAASKHQTCEIDPIPTADLALPAPRPNWSVLDCSKITQTFGIRPANFSEGLSEALARAQAEGSSGDLSGPPL